MKLLSALKKSIVNYSDRDAFFINGVYFKYSDLAGLISKVRKAIRDSIPEYEKNVGLVTNDDLETYSAIIALWFEGKAFIPLNPDIPNDRNQTIIGQASLKTIIDSSETPLFKGYDNIEIKNLPNSQLDLIPRNVAAQDRAYILFTSGTTGQPKGVPITQGNLSAFVSAFLKIGFDIDEKDRFLQMFDLTFDFSVASYVVPLLKGSCIYTIPKNVIKYSFIAELMEEHELTFVGLVPSVLNYLRPYFHEMIFPATKHCIFCGEALNLQIVTEWSKCLPNARIHNFYGPTECTIFCTCYPDCGGGRNKAYNGILSIGKIMDGTKALIIDENGDCTVPGEVGQLCLAGKQLSPGYWNDKERNQDSFFISNIFGKDERFYKTGDLCFFDKDTNLMYVGRVDSQIKMQGYRVELSEIEYHVRSFLGNTNAAVVSFTDVVGNVGIGLVIESAAIDVAPLNKYIGQKMASYMIPTEIRFVDRLPINANGKTDRKKLELLFRKNDDFKL